MTNEAKLKELRDAGFKVFVTHRRPVIVNDEVVSDDLYTDRQRREVLQGNTEFAPTGGETTVQIVADDGSVVSYGAAVCSDYDTFSKKRGLMIALGRATLDEAERERRRTRDGS